MGMKLSDAGFSASAEIPDPNVATTVGGSFYDQAVAFAKGTATNPPGIDQISTAAAGIVSSLPAGQIKTAVSQAQNILASVSGAAAEGGAVGGIYGAAIGAAIGALTTIFSDISSGNAPPVQGDLRGTAEQYCFPSLPLSVSYGSGTTDSQNAQINKFLFQPAARPDERIYLVGMKPLNPGADNPTGLSPATGDGPALAVAGDTAGVAFNFGVGWVSPPGSTQATTEAGYYLGQSWIGTNGLYRPATNDQADYVRAMVAEAGTVIGAGGSEVSLAMNLLSSWYGTPANFYNSITLGCGGNCPPDIAPNRDGAFYTPGSGVPWMSYATQWAAVTTQVNLVSALDYLYYVSDSTWFCSPFWTQASEAGLADIKQLGSAASGGFLGTGSPGPIMSLVACPDTTIFGLAEIAAMYVMQTVGPTGAVLLPTRRAADLMALHYVLGLQWLWSQGNHLDMSQGTTSLSDIADAAIFAGQWSTRKHPNFSRLLGRIHAKVGGSAQVAAKAASSAASSSASSAESAALAHLRSAASKKAGSGGGVSKAALGVGVLGAALWWFLR